ncbi:hypothetical protein KFE25_002104 [Diacronema lutheri]|uniref:Aminoglycoside phosphotransferase domain-containing protein n=1 Tax=Diacronema lutheri TaxID=2081491 RepID=A0A8J5XKH0_DIALT|nr:hypothetical protein KFE25_002104 [Diacronema lutheri]
MPKAAISSDLASAELARLSGLFGFGDGTPDSIRATQLFGGYSGETFRIDELHGARRVAALKVCRGYPQEEVRAQAAVQGLIGARGFTGACAALPLVSPPGSAPAYVAQSARGEPVCMLSFVDGVPADAAIDAGADAVGVLRAVGERLASLHAVPVDARADGLRTFRDGGVCLLARHAAGAIGEEMRKSEHTRGHPFVARYGALLAELRAAVAVADVLPNGILHGDPFLDNVLVVTDPPLLQSAAPADGGTMAAQPGLTPVGSVSGAVSGLAHSPSIVHCAFVDFEDAAVGPLVFDVACCAASSCFVRAAAGADGAGASAEELGGVLDAGRLAALLIGYCTVRPLTAAEKRAFGAWLRVSIACNATWRFVNFHIAHREAIEARESYRELEARLEQLRAPDCVAMVHAILNALPQASEDRAAEAPGGGVAAAAGAAAEPPGARAWLDANLPTVAAATAAAGFVVGALLRAGARRKR